MYFLTMLTAPSIPPWTLYPIILIEVIIGALLFLRIGDKKERISSKKGPFSSSLIFSRPIGS